MNGLDWVLAMVGVICVGRGLWRGAVSQVFGIAGVLCGFIVAANYYVPLSAQLGAAFPSLSGQHFVSFAILFFLTWFNIGVIGYLMAKILRRTGLGLVDRTLGAVIGGGKALALAVAIVSALTFFLPSQNPLLGQSILRPYVTEAAGFVMKATPEHVQGLFTRRLAEIRSQLPDGKTWPPGSVAPPRKPQQEDRERKDDRERKRPLDKST